jgi:hypothetical protein
MVSIFEIFYFLVELYETLKLWNPILYPILRWFFLCCYILYGFVTIVYKCGTLEFWNPILYGFNFWGGFF